MNIIRYPVVEVIKRLITIIVVFAFVKIMLMIVILRVIDSEDSKPERRIIALILGCLEMSLR